MKVKFWGVRGSIPTPVTDREILRKIEAALRMAQTGNLRGQGELSDFMASLPPEISGTVGGNTPCVQVDTGDELLILDAGSGLKGLGQALMDGPFGQGRGLARLFISHTHWDHIQGFPFFNPAYMIGNRLEIYSTPQFNLKSVLSAQQAAPSLFPIAFEDLPATIVFNNLPSGPLVLGQATIEYFPLRHPGDSLSFKITCQGKIMVYATDLEFTDTQPETLAPFLKFIRGADMLIFDAQYTFLESIAKEGWGHSTALMGVELAVRAEVKRLFLFHHEPTYEDSTLYDILEKTIAYYHMIRDQGQVDIQLAVEGREIIL